MNFNTIEITVGETWAACPCCNGIIGNGVPDSKPLKYISIFNPFLTHDINLSVLYINPKMWDYYTCPHCGVTLKVIIFDKKPKAENTLQKELDIYNRNKEYLLQYEGQYVVINSTGIIGVYDTYETALKIGYEVCELKSFLVKKIEKKETVHFI